MALIHRLGSKEDGIEFPLKEPITKEMLCTMFDIALEADVFIFFENDYEGALELPESYFLPKTAGKYTVVFELGEKEGARKILERTQRLEEYKIEREKIKYSATLYALGLGLQITVPIGTVLTKELICSFFDRPLAGKIGLSLNRIRLATFDNDLTKAFLIEKPEFYHIWFHDVVIERTRTDEAWFNEAKLYTTCEEVLVPVGTQLSKETLCTMFNRKINQRIDITHKGRPHDSFGLEDFDKIFIPRNPDFYGIYFRGNDESSEQERNPPKEEANEPGPSSSRAVAWGNK